MAGASAGSQVGLLYVGDWSKEERITKKQAGINVHVCLRDTKTKKVIIGIFPNDYFANLFISSLEMYPVKALVKWAKEMREYHKPEPKAEPAPKAEPKVKRDPTKKYLVVRERKAPRKEVKRIELHTTDQSKIEKIMTGMLRQMDTEKYFIDDTEA